jgi:hypothetical protein
LSYKFLCIWIAKCYSAIAKSILKGMRGTGSPGVVLSNAFVPDTVIALSREQGLFRDLQGVRYHPLREKTQHQLSGQLAQGWDISSL